MWLGQYKRLTSLCFQSPFLSMRTSVPTRTPQAETLSRNDCWQTGTMKYRALLFLAKWKWQLFQSSPLPCTLVEQSGQAAPAQMQSLPLLSGTLDLFLDGKMQVSHDRWLKGLLKKFSKSISKDTAKSTTEREGHRDLPYITTGKLLSLTCLKLSVGTGWRKCKMGPTSLQLC